MFRGRRARLASLLVLAVVAALVPGTALGSGKTSTQIEPAGAALDVGVLDQLNQIRREHGLVPLRLSPELSAAARAHSVDMLENGYFAHTSSNGAQFWQRIEQYWSQSRFGYWSVGENLFWTSGTATATQGMQAWMASPPHRRNILDPIWRQIGIGAVSSPDAPGTFDNLGVTVITTDFGVRH